MGQQEVRVTDDLELLFSVLPPAVREALEALPESAELLEVVLDLGRPPEVRLPERGQPLDPEPVTAEDIQYVVERVGTFGQDNRAGIERTLHRISAMRNRVGDAVGLTCRVGRAVFGTVDVVRDVVEAGRSVLLLGRPGVGKTTLLREAARVLADQLEKRVVVVDTSNEIAGDGDVPHPGIGRARRMQVPRPSAQHAVMIECVENHMPEVVVIDEIGTEAEALAARTIAERGVQLIATAHGNTLENLLQNPTLADLVGGVQAVTLSDDEARRRRTRKTVLERKAPPTFDVVIEIHKKDQLAVHHGVAQVVDRLLLGVPPRPEVRRRTADGEVEIETPAPEPARAPHGPAPWRVRPSRGEGGGPAPPRPRRRPLSVFPYAVSRGHIERAFTQLRARARIVPHPMEADVIVTVKGQVRRQPKRLREAIDRGVRLEVVRSNTWSQIKGFVLRELGLDDDESAHEAALREVQDAIDQVMRKGLPVELPPRDRHLRRLQHEQVGESGLVSRSADEEPHRRVVVFPG